MLRIKRGLTVALVGALAVSQAQADGVLTPGKPAGVREGRPHLVATVTAAAPHQRARGREGAGLRLLPRDLRFARREGSRISHEYANLNDPPNVRLIHSPVESWIERMPRADSAFLDPPRSGAKRNDI